MENVKQQQDKIMRTASYKPTYREIENPDADSTPGDVSAQNSAAANAIIVGRNRRVTEQNLVGQTIYTVYSNPQVVSYKELSETHTTEDTARLERVRKLIFEIKKSPKYGADIMRGFISRNSKIGRNQQLEAADSRCLMNLSNLFYDNLYQEEIKGSPLKQSYFVLAFENFVKELKFKRD